MARYRRYAATPFRRAASRARSSCPQESLEDQVSKLQDDIKAIGVSLAKLSDSKVSEARSAAKTQYKSLVKSGQHVVDDLGDQVERFRGARLPMPCRERPLTAVAGAIERFKFLIALLSRR